MWHLAPAMQYNLQALWVGPASCGIGQEEPPELHAGAQESRGAASPLPGGRSPSSCPAEWSHSQGEGGELPE